MPIYENSINHTYESFAARQAQRMAAAKKDQQAIEGSVYNTEDELLEKDRAARLLHVAPPAVIYLRDESGFGPADIPATDCCGYEPEILDVYEEARGG